MPRAATGRRVDLRRLVAGFLRMAPDVAIVGEVRDREALPLLLTLSSGVTGYTTIHAGSARQALTRLRFICQLADTSGGLPLAALNSLVSESVDVVVQCIRTPAGPRVTEVAMVEDLAGGADATHFTVTEVFRRPGPDQPLAWTGDVPARAARTLADAGFDVRSLLEDAGRVAVTGLLLAAVAAAGVHYLYTAVALGWRGLGAGPATPRTTVRRRRHTADWLAQAGLVDVDVRRARRGHRRPGRSSAPLAGLLLFGGPLPALALAACLAAVPAASTGSARPPGGRRPRSRGRGSSRRSASSRRRSVARCPRRCSRPAPRAPASLRPAFEAARREWVLSTDFERTVRVLKAGLADPTADAACETLLVAHEVGGTDLDRRLEALIDDRMLDVQGRKDAAAGRPACGSPGGSRCSCRSGWRWSG